MLEDVFWYVLVWVVGVDGLEAVAGVVVGAHEALDGAHAVGGDDGVDFSEWEPGKVFDAFEYDDVAVGDERFHGVSCEVAAAGGAPGDVGQRYEVVGYGGLVVDHDVEAALEVHGVVGDGTCRRFICFRRFIQIVDD